MPSMRSRIFYLLLKYQPLKADKNATLQQRRAIFEGSARYLPIPLCVDVQQTTIGNIAAEWLRPAGTTDGRAVLYLHGGAYSMGSCTTHRALASRIAIASQTPALLSEFRLAPEYPFLAALEDGVAVYRWLIEQGISPQKMAVVGDSSGGSLAIALTVSLRDKEVPLPAAITCLSPWADLELTGESLTTRARVDPVCSLEESQCHASTTLANTVHERHLFHPSMQTYMACRQYSSGSATGRFC
jgi:monoterpene epsilon-lactone hydrolase